jgi:rSAM/selenodomain-associated transferase 2
MGFRISVIIPARNEEACVAAAVRSAWDAGADEVWVVDGESQDQTAQQAAHAGAQVVRCSPGRARQQNLGAMRSNADVLVFLHADCRLAATALQQLRQLPVARPIFGAYRQRIEAEGVAYRWLEWANALRVRWWGVPYGDQAIFVRRDLFVQVGGFPEEPILEDVLLAQRLKHLARPVLLEGPVWVSARRWKRYGVLRQTVRNRVLILAWLAGIPPCRLVGYYPRHDQ